MNMNHGPHHTTPMPMMNHHGNHSTTNMPHDKMGMGMGHCTMVMQVFYFIRN